MAQLSIVLGNNQSLTVEATFGEQEKISQQIHWGMLPSASQDHIIRVGLTNILRDSMAGKAGDDVEARQAMVDKLGRVLSGDVSGAARGPRKDPTTRAREAYLTEVIQAHCKAKGITMLKGKDLAEAMAKVYEANAAKVDAEVKRRLKVADMALDLAL